VRCLNPVAATSIPAPKAWLRQPPEQLHLLGPACKTIGCGIIAVLRELHEPN
jgi:hypothetical protein